MDVIQDISPLDDMYQGNRTHYFGVGESALASILSIISAAGRNPSEIQSILDFPCGFGRVLRNLKAAFPTARLTACDLERKGVDFCARTFGAYPVYSNKRASEIPIRDRFDLIWVGSLLTHLDIGSWHDFFGFFASRLNPGGLLVMSFHGPRMIQRITEQGVTYGLSSISVASLLKQYNEKQFAYENYPNSREYGISVASPGFIRELVTKHSDLRIVSYAEHAWDNHHDVLGCQKEESLVPSRTLEQEGRSNPTLASPFAKMQSVPRQHEYRVVFSLPEGLTLGGVTTWSVQLSRELRKAGRPTALAVHPSRYHNPPVDFGITKEDDLIDCSDLPHPDDPELNPEDYLPYYRKALPAILIPSWSWGTYAMTALLASQQSEMLRVIGMAHADESGYYQWLVHYEAIIHKFIVANHEIERKLSRMIPLRSNDILVRPCPVRVPAELVRTYSADGHPLQLVYGGRIAQYQKRVFELLDLIKALVKENVKFNFRIIGGGADEQQFYKEVNLLPQGVRAMISMEESVPLSELPEIWRSADINILVSDFEGVSNSMLMGMAEGCVPVMTEVSGTSEVITSGVDGYLTPVGDIGQMVQVIKMLDRDRGQLATLGKNAHAKMGTAYSIEEYALWFENIMDEIVAQPARPWPPEKSPESLEAIHKQFTRLAPMAERNAPKSPDRRKRILFLSHDANWGGASKVLYSLVTGLDRDRWLPIVAIPYHGDLEIALDKIGVKTVTTPMQHMTTDARDYWQQYRRFSSDLRQRVDKVTDIIDREQVELVVTNTACIVEGALAAKLGGIPHIWYIHELVTRDKKLTPILDYPAFYATVDSLSDRIVVISKTVRDEISQIFPSRKLELIYTGLKAGSQNLSGDRREILGVAPEIPVVTFVGVLSERKGVFSLLDTARIVAKKIPNVLFVMAGGTEGGAYEDLRLMIKERRLDHNFDFVGFRSDVPEVLTCSDVIVIPSIVEPFSLVALEAMQNGRPVVATRSGGPEEIILDGETGILVPVNSPLEMAEAITGLLSDSNKAISMGRKGQAHANATFGYEQYLEHFESLFQEVTSQPRTGKVIDKNVVDNIIKLTAVAARTKGDLAENHQGEGPVEDVMKLLTYPGNVPFEIEPCDTRAQKGPKVSVCIPVFNGEHYIGKCIDSILSQTFAEFELIIVNDASTDRSKRVIRSYKDPRIRYYENDVNLGLIGNWNRCLELSSGTYVCVFHQDDVMAVENLGKKVMVLDSDDRLGMVYSDAHIIDKAGRTKLDHWFNLIDPNVDFVRTGQSFFDLLFRSLNLVSCPTVLARRACYEQVGGFDQRLPFSVDMEMWLRIALFYNVAYLAQPLIQYRYHDSNLTHRYADLDLIHIYLCKKIILEKYPGRFSDSSYHAALVDDTSQRVFERAVHHFYQDEYRLAKQYLAFLKMIRNSSDGPGLIDFYVGELLKFVDQANALKWIGSKR